MKRLALLPAGALLVAALLVSGAYVVRDDGTTSTATQTADQPARPNGQTPQARAKNNGSVCQSSISRPDPKGPRTFDPSYTKIAEASGIAIVATEAVDDAAIDEAKKTIERLFRNNDREAELVAEGAYVIVLAAGQGVLDTPEFSCLADDAGSSFFSHVCGVADRADYPVVTVSELDMTGARNGPCRGLNVLYHELGHLVQGWTLEHADYLEVKVRYQEALDAGKYRGEYAATNPNEYFAEATQSFFYRNQPGRGRDRAWLKEYDRPMYDLLARIYGEE